MLNITDYNLLYLAKLRNEKLMEYFELDESNKEQLLIKQKQSEERKKKPVRTQILKMTGNALVATGNRLLGIV